jgi:hypothetical protein
VPDIYGVVGSLVKEGRLVRNGSGRAGVLRVPR